MTGLEHRYKHYGECSQLFGYRGDELLLSGPAGTGKSRACLEKLNLAALKYPGMRGAISRKTAAFEIHLQRLQQLWDPCRGRLTKWSNTLNCEPEIKAQKNVTDIENNGVNHENSMGRQR